MKPVLYTQFFPLLYIMLTVGYCGSCDKNEPETVCTTANTVSVPQDLKDRFLFHQGTWWVYENIQTSIIDSFWVVSSHVEIINVDNNVFGNIKNKCYEAFETAIQSSSNTVNWNYTKYGISLYPKAGFNLPNELFGLKDSYSIQPNDAFYRLEIEGDNYSNQMGATIKHVDSIVTDQGLVYKDILHIFYPTGIQTYDYLLDMYYAKNIGLVKFHRRADNSHWELVRHQIKQ